MGHSVELGRATRKARESVELHRCLRNRRPASVPTDQRSPECRFHGMQEPQAINRRLI
jgi:hypothetical protein